MIIDQLEIPEWQKVFPETKLVLTDEDKSREYKFFDLVD